MPPKYANQYGYAAQNKVQTVAPANQRTLGFNNSANNQQGQQQKPGQPWQRNQQHQQQNTYQQQQSSYPPKNNFQQPYQTNSTFQPNQQNQQWGQPKAYLTNPQKQWIKPQQQSQQQQSAYNSRWDNAQPANFVQTSFDQQPVQFQRPVPFSGQIYNQYNEINKPSHQSVCGQMAQTNSEILLKRIDKTNELMKQWSETREFDREKLSRFNYLMFCETEL